MTDIDRRYFLASASALLAAGTPRLAAAQMAALRIATIPIDAAAQAYYAADMGFFKKAGLDATLETINNGPQIIPVVVSGSLDIGFANLIPIAQAYLKGLPLTIIAPAALYSSAAPTTALMVANDSPIRTAKDLNGKTIGTAAVGGNITQLGPLLWMDKNGGDSKSIKWVEIPTSELPAALKEGRIDAIVGLEPGLTEAKRQGARLLANALDTIGESYVLGGWFAMKPWAATHRELVAKTAGALQEAGRWANTHKRESAAILLAHTKLQPEIAAQMTRAVYAERFDPKLMQPELDVGTKYGVLGRPVSIAEILYDPKASS
jgi:NitT/TauT family transport system substrate-binding protein